MISTKRASYNQQHDRPLGRTVLEAKRVWKRPENAGDAKLPGMFVLANEYFERISDHSTKPIQHDTKSDIDATMHSNKAFEGNWSNHSARKRYARGVRIKNERETFTAEDEEERSSRPVVTVEMMERPSTPKRERRRGTRTPSSPSREQRCVSPGRTSLASNSTKMLNKGSCHQSVATTPTVTSSVSCYSPNTSWSSIGFDGTITAPSSPRRRQYIGSPTPKSPNPNKNAKYISVFSKSSSKPSQSSSSSLGTFLTPDSKSRRCDNSTITTNEDSFANLSLMTPQERVKLIDVYQEEISKRTSPIDLSVADSALFMLRKATLDCKIATSRIIDTYHLNSDDDDGSSDESDSDSDDDSVDISECGRYRY